MSNYTYEELERIADAVRGVWQDCYRGGFLPGMRAKIGDTGVRAFQGLIGDVIVMQGGSLLSGPLKAIIGMQGVKAAEEALRIEDGYAPYDMKPGFLRSPKALVYQSGPKAGQTKKTPHLIISFRHVTPGSTSTLGSPMTTSLHRAAKKGINFQEQLGTAEDPSDYGLVNSKGYEWQNGAHAGMTNVGGKGHSQYRTFRIVSANSAPNSWWNPGQQPNKVIDATIKYAEPYIKEGLKRAAKAEVIEHIQGIFNKPVRM
jgi:hypothetical protein